MLTAQPETLIWSEIGQLPPETGHQSQPGLAGPVCAVLHDKLILAGGANFPDALPWEGGTKTYHDAIFIGEIRAKNIHWLVDGTQSLPYPVAYAAQVPTPRGLVCVGGENAQGSTSRAWLLNLDKNNHLRINSLPDFPYPITNATAASLGSIIYVAGGENAEFVSDRLWVLDLDNLQKGWQEGPMLPYPVTFATLSAHPAPTAPKLYLVGGRKRNANQPSDLYAGVWQLDLEHPDAQWKATTPLPAGLSAHSSFTTAKHLVVLSGDRGETFSRVEAINIQLKTTSDTQQQKNLNERKHALLVQHPGFSRVVLALDFNTDIWRMWNPLPAEPPVTTHAVIYKRFIILPNGEIKPGVRTPRIWMGKLKKVRS